MTVFGIVFLLFGLAMAVVGLLTALSEAGMKWESIWILGLLIAIAGVLVALVGIVLMFS